MCEAPSLEAMSEAWWRPKAGEGCGRGGLGGGGKQSCAMAGKAGGLLLRHGSREQ